MQGLSFFATDVCLTLICKGTALKRQVVLRKTARPQDHHSLLHISTKNEIEDIEGNPEQSSPVVSTLSVNNATT